MFTDWRKVFALNHLNEEAEDILKELYDADRIQILIESVKGNSPDNKYAPVDTRGFFTLKERGKKYYFTEADSGEQEGIATSVPGEVKKILLAFGHNERVDQNDNIIERKLGAKGKEERTYKISGDPDQLDLLELVFSFMSWCNAVGSSRSIRIFTDGDGAANVTVERVNGKLKELPKEVLEKERDWSEGEASYDESELSIGLGT